MYTTLPSVAVDQSTQMRMARLLAFHSTVCIIKSHYSASKANWILGSAVYVFGDKVDDHGLFTVTLDNRTSEHFDGVSGCGGAFAKACEKTNTLAYFASNLDSSLHTVTVQNNAGVNNSYFGALLVLSDWIPSLRYFIQILIASCIPHHQNMPYKDLQIRLMDHRAEGRPAVGHPVAHPYLLLFLAWMCSCCCYWELYGWDDHRDGCFEVRVAYLCALRKA